VKIGSEDKTKVRVMLGALAVAALIGFYNLLSSSSSAAAPSAAPAAASTTAQKRSDPEDSLDPTIHLHELRASQSVTYQGSGRNIFRMEQIVIPDVAHSVRPPLQPPYVPPIIETGKLQPANPITIKFYGFASRPGEQKRVFISDGGEHFVAREGQIIDRRYKIVHISDASLIVEDVLNNTKHDVLLTSGPN
jgi:hypothetical protein